jgi:very-short-patch-repair endonuclease
MENDQVRTNYLENLNIRVLRFENKDVFEQTEAVIEEVRRSFRK